MNNNQNHLKASNILTNPDLNNFDLEKLKDKTNDESYYFLLLTIYFYLKHNNYHSTAEILFTESNLGRIFTFPQDVFEGTTDIDQMKKKFIHYFYYNTYFQQSGEKKGNSVDFLSEFWNQFWDIFVDKIRQSNNTQPAMDEYLKLNKLTPICI
jgi:hypothetical protein